MEGKASEKVNFLTGVDKAKEFSGELSSSQRTPNSQSKSKEINGMH